jgi:hypothetical protein
MTEDDPVERLKNAVNADVEEKREDHRQRQGQPGTAPISNDVAGIRLSFEDFQEALGDARRAGGTREAVEKAAREVEAKSGGQFDALSLVRRVYATPLSWDEFFEKLRKQGS